MTTQRSYSDFIVEIKKSLPKYFGFEGLGIMFRDVKTGSMFTIEQNFDDTEVKQMNDFIAKKRAGIPVSDEERILDFERQMKRR